MARSIRIVSDVVCPWCYVGKRRLEAALAETGLAPTIQWLPFELNPDLPPEGIDRALYRERKFGAGRMAEMDARMTETGREAGIAFAFDRATRMPNSRRAHALILHAAGEGRADAVVEGLFRAFFGEGRDVGDPAVLGAVAAAAGLDPADTGRALADAALDARVAALENGAVRAGIGGVPFFIVDESWSVSGAQPAAWWAAELRGRAA